MKSRTRQVRQSRFCLIVLAILVSLSAILVTAGCQMEQPYCVPDPQGVPTPVVQEESAKALINSGDEAIARLDSELLEYMKEVDGAVLVIRQNPPSQWLALADNFPEQVGALRAHYSALKQHAAAITATFRKIYDMRDVAKYRKYADLRIQYVALIDSQLENIEDYIGWYFNLWGQMSTSPPPDPQITVDCIQEIEGKYQGRMEEIVCQKQVLARDAQVYEWEKAL